MESPAQSGGGFRDEARRRGLPFVDSVADAVLDPELIASLPISWAREHGVLPVVIEGRPSALCADPGQIAAVEDLGLLIGRKLEPVLAERGVISEAIERCYYKRDASPEAFVRALADEAPAVEVSDRSEDLLSAAETAPVTQLVNLMLLEAVKSRASDIHFEPCESRLRVRYRIDGVLYEQASPPGHLARALVSRVKVMARMDISETRLPQDGMAGVRVGGREIDIRASSIPVTGGERVVLRLLDRNAGLVPLEDLGMPGALLRGLRSVLSLSSGLLVVSGPTGSGKTTTLYAALCGLDARRRNILTVEDPVEYRLADIGQMQVRPKIGVTFASGLRHLLRQDPDILLVGEMRDRETADIAVRAALTGHLVLTTLHTTDAPSAVLRLIDMGIEPCLLGASLTGVLAQRLVRRLCGKCRSETVASSVEWLGEEQRRRVAGARVWEPAGCDACKEGYCGRVGLFELLKATPQWLERLRTDIPGAEALRKLAADAGMRPLSADGIDKVLAGMTSLEEVRFAVTR